MATAALLRTRPWRTKPSIGSKLLVCQWPRPPGLAVGFSQSPSSSFQRQKSTDADAGADADGASHSQMLGSSLSRILTDEQRSLFNQVNQLSSMSRSLARKVGNVPVKEDSLLADIARLQNQRRLRQQQQQASKNDNDTQQKQKIDEASDDTAPPSLFTVVFAGEFNAGKSTLINALLGKEFLDAGVLPTTDAITIIMANDDDSDSNDEKGTTSVIESASVGLDNKGAPSHTQLHLLPTSKFPILSDLCLIDTPGTNAILSLQHTSSTLRILHDADLIVFVTSADRPFSESEKQLLQTSIKSYRKRVVLVINKMDVLERQQGEDHGEVTKKRVEEYVVEHAGDLLGARPVVIPLSARDALSVKLLYNNSQQQTNDGGAGSSGNANNQSSSSLWKRCNFGQLEHFLSKSLTSSSKVRTKLLNPLGVSEGILIDCQSELERRQEELDVDVMTLRLLTSQTNAWEKEIQAEVIDKCRSRVKGAISNRSEVTRRVLEEISPFEQFKMGMGFGRDIFDRAWENASLQGRGIPWKSKSQDGHSDQNSLENGLLSIVNECTETLSSRAQSQGNASIEYLGKRPAVIGSASMGRDGSGISRMVGSITVPKFQRLKELQSSMTAVVQDSVDGLPNDSQYADQVYTTLRRNVLLSSVLMGSGAVPAVLSVLGTLDMTTGMIACGTIATLGGASLPLGNRHIASTFEKEWDGNAAQLEKVLDSLFLDAMDLIRSELSESVAPYSRYVETEGNWLDELNGKMGNGISSAQSLRSKINKACQ